MNAYKNYKTKWQEDETYETRFKQKFTLNAQYLSCMYKF